MLAGAIGGAIGGLSGAAIEKSSLARGALQGAAIGAAVGAGAYGAQGAGGAGAGGGGSGADSTAILRPAGWQDSGAFEITGVSKAVAESGLGDQVKIIVGNALFGGVAWAAESAPKSDYTFTAKAVRAGSESMTGHAWFSLSSPSGTKDYGFGPAQRVLNPWGQYKGKLGYNDSSLYKNYVEHSWDISKMQYDEIVNFAKSFSSKPYCGVSRNCADMLLGAAKIAGVDIPRSDSKRAGISDPNRIADYLETQNEQSKSK